LNDFYSWIYEGLEEGQKRYGRNGISLNKEDENNSWTAEAFQLITNLPEGFTICTHRHPCPRTSLRIRKNSQKIEKTLSQGKKGKFLQKNMVNSIILWP